MEGTTQKYWTTDQVQEKLEQYRKELAALKAENEKLRHHRDVAHKDCDFLLQKNERLKERMEELNADNTVNLRRCYAAEDGFKQLQADKAELILGLETIRHLSMKHERDSIDEESCYVYMQANLEEIQEDCKSLLQKHQDK